MLNVVLIFLVSNYLISRKNHFALFFYLLVIAFNYIPFLILNQVGDVSTLVDLKDILVLELVCFFWSLSFIAGVVVSNLVFKANYTKAQKKYPDLISLKKHIVTLNIAIAVSMLINNVDLFFIVSNSGYLSAYENVEPVMYIRNTSLLPFYLLTLVLSIEFSKNSLRHYSIKLIYVLFFFLIMSYFLCGGRSTSVYFLLVIFAYYFKDKKIKIIKSAFWIFLSIIILSLIGLVREGGGLGGDEALYMRPIRELFQTVLVFFNSINVMKVPENHYLDNLFYLLPGFMTDMLNMKAPISLSTIYVETVDPSWANLGGGLGFSILAEMYLILGYLSVILMSFGFGNLASYVDRKFKYGDSLGKAVGAILAFYLFLLPRGELVDLYRTVEIILILIILSKIDFSFIKTKNDNFVSSAREN